MQVEGRPQREKSKWSLWKGPGPLVGNQSTIRDYLYTWNPNDPCFGWKRPCFGGLTFKNRGHLGFRYIYIFTRWWFELFFIFTPIFGEIIQFDLRIFFKWVES